MKPQTWFRLYNEVVDDPKVQQLPPRLFKNWINFMCMVSKGGGTLPPWKEVAYRLRTTESTAQKWLDELKEAGLFEEAEGAIYSHNWDHRQFRSDVSTDRVRTFRERQRNVSETPPETPATEHNKAETYQTPKPPKGDSVPYSTEFLALWAVYPRGEGKGAAWKAWQKLRPSEQTQALILEAVEKQKRWPQWAREAGKFIPHCATWLNRRQWEDRAPNDGPPSPQRELQVAL
jgi:hypothetical protein